MTINLEKIFSDSLNAVSLDVNNILKIVLPIVAVVIVLIVMIPRIIWHFKMWSMSDDELQDYTDSLSYAGYIDDDDIEHDVGDMSYTEFCDVFYPDTYDSMYENHNDEYAQYLGFEGAEDPDYMDYLG